MSSRRDIRDYGTLAAVRKRRGLALQQQLREAQAAHDACRDRQDACASALDTSRHQRDGYLMQVAGRTIAGRSVRLGELEGARGHGKALQAACDQAMVVLRNAEQATGTAREVCADLRRRVAANEARVTSLQDQAARWKRALDLAAEDAEEEERNDGGRGLVPLR